MTLFRRVSSQPRLGRRRSRVEPESLHLSLRSRLPKDVTRLCLVRVSQAGPTIVQESRRRRSGPSGTRKCLLRGSCSRMLYLFKLHPSCDVLYGLVQEPEVPFQRQEGPSYSTDQWPHAGLRYLPSDRHTLNYRLILKFQLGLLQDLPSATIFQCFTNGPTDRDPPRKGHPAHL